MSAKYDERRVPVKELAEGDLFNPPLCWGTIGRVRRLTRVEGERGEVGFQLWCEVVEGDMDYPFIVLHEDAPVTLLIPKTTFVAMSGREFIRKAKEMAGE